MDVVGVVLRVVIFEQEGRALHAVVMAIPPFQPAGPREGDGVPARLVDLGQVTLRHVRADAVGVFGHDLFELLLLGSVQLAVGDARRGEALGGPVSAGDDVLGRDFVEDGGGALLGAEGLHQFTTKVFLHAQHAETFLRTFANFGGVGAHEGGDGGDFLAVHDREAQREVMALEAPRPGALRIRRAVDADEIENGVAVHAAALFKLTEDRFQAHDAGGLGVAGFAHGGLEQGEGELALRLGHLGHRQTLASETHHLGRDEVPGMAGIRLEVGIVRLGLLLGLEGAEQGLGRRRHGIGGGMGLQGKGEGTSGQQRGAPEQGE